MRGLIASKQLDIAQMAALSQQGLAQLSPENHLLRGLAVSNLALDMPAPFTGRQQ
ncbi:MAG: hypothetical protein GY943_36735 [Chloroflexi bacterium]|nr:hypothetical protein [Chloroflexota bacterium]